MVTCVRVFMDSGTAQGYFYTWQYLKELHTRRLNNIFKCNVLVLSAESIYMWSLLNINLGMWIHMFHKPSIRAWKSHLFFSYAFISNYRSIISSLKTWPMVLLLAIFQILHPNEGTSLRSQKSDKVGQRYSS